jgi:hypothetical protein
MRILYTLSSVAALMFATAAHAQDAAGAQRLFFEGDMVRGQTEAGATGPTCVLTNQFKRKEQVVWRLRVLDPRTGQPLDDKGLKRLVVTLSDGQQFAARFGTHPQGTPTDSFWSVSWMIPEAYPTGSFAYKVIATDLQGQSHTWEPFKVSFSQLTVIPGDVTFTK